jgi:outer membrane protein assembly factor BamB
MSEKTQTGGAELEKDKLADVSGGIKIENGNAYATRDGDVVLVRSEQHGELCWHTVWDKETNQFVWEADGGKEPQVVGAERVPSIPLDLFDSGEIHFWNNLRGDNA